MAVTWARGLHHDFTKIHKEIKEVLMVDDSGIERRHGGEEGEEEGRK